MGPCPFWCAPGIRPASLFLYHLYSPLAANTVLSHSYGDHVQAYLHCLWHLNATPPTWAINQALDVLRFGCRRTAGGFAHPKFNLSGWACVTSLLRST